MAIKDNRIVRNRVITNFEYMISLNPSKLAKYLRTRLAHNQGCPPVPLMQVFTMCKEFASCDDCWWGWLCAEHVDGNLPEDKKIPKECCWFCRWGVHSDTAHPYVICMNKKLYGVTFDPEDYCSFFTEPYYDEPKKSDVELALAFGELKRENEDKVGDEIRRRHELKLLAMERDRRRKEKELLEEDKADGRTEGT